MCDREPTPGTDFARRNPGTEGTALKLAEVLENSLEIEEILKLANEAPVLEYPLLEKDR